MITHNIDVTQNKQIKFLFATLLALGAFSGFLVYYEQKKHSALNKQILELDREIKELQLRKLKTGKT